MVGVDDMSKILRKKLYNDEVLATFVTGLGQIVGVSILNKKDIPAIKRFAKESIVTDVFIDNKLLSREVD